LFDFLKKKFNKTIKDASETTEEEMTKHDEEFAKDLDNLEEAFSSIEEKYSKTEQEEETSETEEEIEEDNEEIEEKTTETSEEVKEETSEKIDESSQEKEEEISEEEETTEEEKPIDKVEEEKEEISDEEEESEDTTIEDKEIEEQPPVKKEEKKKKRFSFFSRNKDKEEETKEDEEETKEDETLTEEVEETAEQEEESSQLEEEKITEQDKKDTSEEPVKEEKKSRFSFFRRNKKEDKEEPAKEEKKEEETSKDEEKESVVEEKKEKKAPKEEKSGGMFSFITQKTITEDDIEEILDELFMSLLEGDVAYEVADRIVESVKEDLIGKKIKRRGDMELFTTNALKSAITEIIDNGSYDLLGNIEEAKQNGEPYKIMFVGINGTGKTTTIAKLAKYLEKHGYSSVFGASDTFRAGAIEQLEHHAENLNLKIIKHARNSDPAAVAYDAVEHAKATGKDVVLIDTSGRMQTNVNLMDEMKKIKRVSKPDCIMYVGDALMGNDATEQATKFNDVIDIDGIILTKADADAKGGAALSIGHVIHKPILFVGTGQSYDDLMEFKPEWMINLIFED
jgi:fused signal recognition particle receptor